jgi:hypothetical protein
MKSWLGYSTSYSICYPISEVYVKTFYLPVVLASALALVGLTACATPNVLPVAERIEFEIPKDQINIGETM